MELGLLFDTFIFTSVLFNKKNETPNKKELTPEARAILTANMTLEYEFYQFVKERLRLQKRSIGLMGKFMRNFIPSQTFI